MSTITAPSEALPTLKIPHEEELLTSSATTTQNAQYTCNLQVEYPAEDLATMVMVTLSVDAELQPDKVARVMEVDGRRLLITFSATDARFLRASFSAFMDMLVLATRTIEEFGPSS